MAVRSKAWFCGRSLAGIADSNPAGGRDVYYECCVLLGRGLCDGPISLPKASYKVRALVCVCVCVAECDKMQQQLSELQISRKKGD